MQKLVNLLPGVGCVAVLAALAYVIENLPFAPFTLQDGSHPIESMAAGLVLGLLIANFVRIPNAFRVGVKFSMSTLLATGIVLLGFKLDLHTVLSMPITVPIIIVLTSLVALVSAVIAGRLLKGEAHTSLLIGVGNAICGSSAIMAASSSMPNVDKDQVSMAITIVNLLGLIIIFALPALGHVFGITDLQMGLWAGATGQAVPQAIAAGFAFSQGAGVYATAIKLTRVLQLGPYVIVMKWLNRKHHQHEQHSNFIKKFLSYVPLFVILFLVVILVNSYITLPSLSFLGHYFSIPEALGQLSAFLLTMALTAIGLNTDLKVLLRYGGKNLIIGLVSTLIAVALSLILALL